MSALAKSPSSLAITTRVERSTVVLAADGVLNTGNSAEFRDSITKATLGEPYAVVVDVTALQVPTEATWSVFIAAYWQADIQPNVPIALICANRASRAAITRAGVTRFMPVYASEKRATKAIARLTRRNIHRACAQLPANLNSLREARKLTREWLTTWSRPRLVPVALVIVNVLVENVLKHTSSDPVVRIESDGTTAAISVSDTSNAPAVREAAPPNGIDVSGLAIVAALSRAWGSTPTSSGKTVWAIIGPENQL
ncbi:STAS domain-containing protein [Mycobacterium sp.]|uniref:STAS domain-containing protein n=1 Tax=Mycobacterium sp. TaxID=1785 RepID=UPI003BAC4622